MIRARDDFCIDLFMSIQEGVNIVCKRGKVGYIIKEVK